MTNFDVLRQPRKPLRYSSNSRGLAKNPDLLRPDAFSKMVAVDRAIGMVVNFIAHSMVISGRCMKIQARYLVICIKAGRVFHTLCWRRYMGKKPGFNVAVKVRKEFAADENVFWSRRQSHSAAYACAHIHG